MLIRTTTEGLKLSNKFLGWLPDGILLETRVRQLWRNNTIVIKRPAKSKNDISKVWVFNQ